MLRFILLSILVFSKGHAGEISIISPATLHKNLNQFVVIDARENGFLEGHVPGSRHLDWKTMTEIPPYQDSENEVSRWGKIDTSESFIQRLQELGLSNATPIVVVGDPSSWGEEGRVAWNLLYWGAENVSLLDGGYPAWNDGTRPTQREVSLPPPRGLFTFRPANNRRALKSEILDRLSHTNGGIFDVRSFPEFLGLKAPGQKRAGHIPRAHFFSYQELFEKDGSYIKSDRLKKMISQAALAAPPITYCTGGVRSALLALLLEARLGILAKNYDGSLWEWSADERLPMKIGP